jgi:thiamine-monophosphate kinase
VNPDNSSPPAAGGLAELGEFGLISALAARFPASPAEIVGIGDDSAVLAAPDGNVVAAVDFLLEGRHFRREWSSGRDVGVKSAARSLADIAAMGAVPATLLIALAVPESLPARWALDFASGVAAECERAGAGVAGGDTARADSVIVSVTALGSLPAGAPAVRRSGARPGDVVAVAGPLGYSAAGLALLAAGIADGAGDGTAEGTADGTAGDSAGDAGDGALAALVAAHLRPSPPYAAGVAAARLGATAMIDTSDGLLADLGHIAEASGVAVDVAAGRLPVPRPLLAAAQALRREYPSVTTPAVPAALPPALEWVLTGGEDHSLAATFPAGVALPRDWRVIGVVRAGSGVTVDGQPYAGPAGWKHFLPWGINTNPPDPRDGRLSGAARLPSLCSLVPQSLRSVQAHHEAPVKTQ